MKFNWNSKYTAISIYACGVIFISMIFALLLFKLPSISAFLLSLIKMLMPFIYGFCLAYILSPIVKWQEQKVFPKLFGDKINPSARRAISTTFSILFALSVVVAFFSIIIPQLTQSISRIGSQIPDYIKNVSVMVDNLYLKYGSDEYFIVILAKITSSVEEFLSEFSDKIPEMVNNTILRTISITTGIFSGIIKILVGIIISIYLLVSKEKFFAQTKKFMYAVFPNKFVNNMIAILHNSNRIFSGFISGKLLDSLIIGGICFISMILLKLDYAMLISVIIGITNIIPYFGPFIGAIPSCLFLLMIDPLDALIFAVFIIILQQIDGNIIGPKILGDSTGLSAIWVIFSITIFGGMWGFFGMFIGVPLFAVIYSLIKSGIEHLLRIKNKPTQTSDYVSPEHPIPTKDSPLKQFISKK